MVKSVVMRLVGAVLSLGVIFTLSAGAADDQGPSVPEPERPVEQELQAMSESLKGKAPEAVKTFEEGIKEVRVSGILDRVPRSGDKAELFELPDSTGKTVKLADHLEKGPVVLTWYRGGWCPFCNIGLRGLLKVEPQIRDLGATLVAISPERPDRAAQTAKTNALTFPVLSDKGNAVAKTYKIVFKVPEKSSAVMRSYQIDLANYNGDDSDELPLSVTYVIDQDRTIRWAFVNADYRERAEPADVLEALQAIKDAKK